METASGADGLRAWASPSARALWRPTEAASGSRATAPAWVAVHFYAARRRRDGCRRVRSVSSSEDEKDDKETGAGPGGGRRSLGLQASAGVDIDDIIRLWHDDVHCQRLLSLLASRARLYY